MKPHLRTPASRRALGALWALVLALASLVVVAGAQPARATWSAPAVTFVGVNTGFSAGGSTPTVSAAVPAGAKAGDTLIVSLTTERNLVPTLSGVGSLTSIHAAVDANNLNVQTGHRRLEPADLGQTVTASVSSNRRMSIVVAVYRNVGSVDSATAGAVSAPGTTVSTPSVTPARDNSTIVGVVNFLAHLTPAPRLASFTVTSPSVERADVCATHPTEWNPATLLGDRTISGGAGASQSGLSATSTMATGRYFASTIALGPQTEREYRDTYLVAGVDEPNADHTGVLPDVPLSTINGNVTLDDDDVLENADVVGRVSVIGSDVTIRNVRVRGSVTPTGDWAMITATNANVSNLLIEHVTLRPDTPHWNWDSGITGHDFTVRFTDISHTVDGINVFNTAAAQPYASNVTIRQNYIHDLAWWTATSGGVVHPSDTETHNDAIQHQGGVGTVVVGNSLHGGPFAKQLGHWFVEDPNAAEYETVDLNSLPGGGPYQTIPDRGFGTEANGRYNWDDQSNLMVSTTSSTGPSYGFTFTDNWLYGGNFSVNAGGVQRASGQNMGSFLRNRFDRSQGDETIVFHTTWSGNVTTGVGTANANRYLDNNAEVTVKFFS
jgi:hypothetical protein